MFTFFFLLYAERQHFLFLFFVIGVLYNNIIVTLFPEVIPILSFRPLGYHSGELFPDIIRNEIALGHCRVYTKPRHKGEMECLRQFSLAGPCSCYPRFYMRDYEIFNLFQTISAEEKLWKGPCVFGSSLGFALPENCCNSLCH